MVFGTRYILRKFQNISVSYNDDCIDNADKFKYVGVTFDPLLSWYEHVNYISSNISQRISWFNSQNWFYLPNDFIKILANALSCHISIIVILFGQIVTIQYKLFFFG